MSSDKPWLEREKVIGLLEGHLDQSAKILHDQHLPVLTSATGRTRQIDLLILQGEQPRLTRSIVEVQRRPDKKPEINEFNGWLVKMREVGAQHLICVSQKGFPASIVEVAEQQGPTVRLLTFKELESPDAAILPAFDGKMRLATYHRIVYQEFHHTTVRIDPRKKSLGVSPEELCIKPPNSDVALTVGDLIDEHLFMNPENLNALRDDERSILSIRWAWDKENRPLYLPHRALEEKWVELRSLRLDVDLTVTSHPIAWGLTIYEQVDWTGELGWIARGEATVGEGEVIKVFVPLKRDNAGGYVAGRGWSVCKEGMKGFMGFGPTGHELHLDPFPKES